QALPQPRGRCLLVLYPLLEQLARAIDRALEVIGKAVEITRRDAVPRTERGLMILRSSTLGSDHCVEFAQQHAIVADQPIQHPCCLGRNTGSGLGGKLHGQWSRGRAYTMT